MAANEETPRADAGDTSGTAPPHGAPPGGAPLQVDIVTIFPEMLAGPLDYGVLARARADGLLDVRVHDLREWTTDRHRSTDDYAYGGGGGMVMRPEALFRAVEDLLGILPIEAGTPRDLPCPVILMTPQGRVFDHTYASELAAHDRLVIVAGRYEGYDERIRRHLASHELSIGDYVLTGGELPALVVTDAVARLRPGVVGHETATLTDSHAAGLLEHPHYTRPPEFRGFVVPEVLLSGHHARVERWRREESLRRTRERRPDLLARAPLTAADRRFLDTLESPPDEAEPGDGASAT